MPKTTTTTVTQNENGQYQVTVPKGLGDAMQLAGAKVEWAVDSQNALNVRVVERGESDD